MRMVLNFTRVSTDKTERAAGKLSQGRRWEDHAKHGIKNLVQAAFNFRVNFYQGNRFASGRQSHEVVTAECD